MSDNIREQTLPWAKLQIIISVIEQQYDNIKMFIKLKEQNMLSLSDIEKRMVTPLMLIFDAIMKAFKEEHILESGVQLSERKLTAIFKSILALPTAFVAFYKNNNWNINQTIRSIFLEIECSCGTFAAAEVEKVLQGMTLTLEENFTELN